MKKIAAFVGLMLLAACGGDRSSSDHYAGAEPAPSGAAQKTRDLASFAGETVTVDLIAERFVKLALDIGQHDLDFVDAYHGPEEWAAEAKNAKRDLQTLEHEARTLINALSGLEGATDQPRGAMLSKNLVAALTRVRMARGETFSFDEETQLLYDATVPNYDPAVFDQALSVIGSLMPGEGPLNRRVDDFRASLAIPEDKLDAVFTRALEECRARTLKHYTLPDTEQFQLGYVRDKPWSGYNWYQGGFESLIEINTDLPGDH